MELYIEKAFIDDLNSQTDENNLSTGEAAFLNILKSYGSLNVFMDFTSTNEKELNSFQVINPFIGYFSSRFPPVGVNSIKDHFFERSKCEQTLIFMLDEQDWFKKAEKKGAICFSIKTFNNKIQSIINSCHIRIDLTQKFKNWDLLKSIKEVPLNKFILSDKYVLADRKNQIIDKNLIPLFQSILKADSDKVNTMIFTEEFKPVREEPLKIREKAKKAHKKISRAINNDKITFRIISFKDFYFNIDFHDRIILTNYITIDCGKGFNLLPWKKSTSQIIIDSIFNKYTYDRHKNLKKCFDQYFEKLQSLETSKFKYYPELKQKK